MDDYGCGIMSGDGSRDQVHTICSIIGVGTYMRDELFICLNDNLPLDKSTKNFLMDRFKVSVVGQKLLNDYSAPHSVNSLFFVYALARKVISNFNDSFLLCSFNVNFLDILKKSTRSPLPEKRIVSLINFYENICDVKIVVPKNISSLVEDSVLFNSFLEKVKDEIFIKKELSKDDVYNFKSCLLKINDKINWEYPFKEEIFMDIERRYLEAFIPKPLIDKKSSYKI